MQPLLPPPRSPAAGYRSTPRPSAWWSLPSPQLRPGPRLRSGLGRSARHPTAEAPPSRRVARPSLCRCVCVVFYFLSRYMWPEGPWWPLATALADNGYNFFCLFLSCSQPVKVKLGRPCLPNHCRQRKAPASRNYKEKNEKGTKREGRKEKEREENK